MKNFKKYLTYTLLGLASASSIMAQSPDELSRFDIASAQPSSPKILVDAHDQGILSNDEVHFFVNNMTFFEDISNDCETEGKKCKYYLIPNVTGQALSSKATNLTVFKSKDKFEAIEEIYDTYKFILDQNDSAELLKIENKIRTIDFKLKFEKREEQIAKLEAQKAELEIQKNLMAEGLPESVKNSFETYLRYTLPNVGVSVGPEDSYEDLINHLQDLRKQRVGQLHLYVAVGYSREAVEIVSKLTRLLKMKNPAAEISYTKTAKPITVKAAYSETDDEDVLGNNMYGKMNFMSVRPGSVISPNGGTVVLDLDYDGIKELQRLGASGSALTFPLDFEMKYDWEFMAEGEVSCKFNTSYKELVTQRMSATHQGEEQYLAVPAPSKEVLEGRNTVLDCKTKTGQIVSKAMMEKLKKIEDEAMAKLADTRNNAMNSYRTWEQAVNSMSSLQGRRIYGEKRFEKIRNFEKKCQVVQVGSSSSSLFGLFSDSSSRAQKVCWEEFQDVIKEKYAPAEVNYINKSVFEQKINEEIHYSFDGYDVINRTVSPNFSFCTKLSFDQNNHDITGSNCSFAEQMESVVGEN